jgi:regulator of sigma E protease
MGLTIMYAVIIFCLLIFVHELGHFSVAKSVGIRVNEFSLGMGPVLLHFEKGETKYSLRAFPIGGFVKMEGEDEDSNDPRAFNKKATWQKALVVVAGSLMNILTTMVLIGLIALSIGTATTIIGDVSEGYPAEKAGLHPGDRILMIDDKPINSWNEVTGYLAEIEGGFASITVDRNGERLVLISEITTDEAGRQIVGITSKLEHSIWKSIQAGVVNTWQLAKDMLGYLVLLFTGGGSINDLVGPVGIVSIINDQAKLGLLYIANLTAIISLNLGIVNLLPLPALDGGRLLFMVLRIFTGKAISDETEAKIHFAGLMLLFALMIYLVIQDVDRFILI